jgi:hypothetical protein
MVIRDTVRIKKATNPSPVQPANTDEIFLSNPAATISENSIIYNENNHQKNTKDMKDIIDIIDRIDVKDVKLKVAGYISGVFLAAQTVIGVAAAQDISHETDTIAQETPIVHESLTTQKSPPEDDLPIMPAQFSIVYPMTSMGNKTIDYRYNLSLNLISGYVGGIAGIEYGGIFNWVERDMRGVQFGGIGNKAGSVTGIQSGGIVNISGDVKGIQFGGIANISKNILGIQYGGIVNMSDEVTGVQFGGIANISDNVKGIQFGGIGNISKEVTGIQFGGIFNRAETLRGIQFGGIVNITDTIEKGVSIALINIIRKGFYREYSLTFADYLNAGFSFKMGAQKFYTIFTVGANFMEDNLWVTGIGFGNRTPMGKRFAFQPEIVGYNYYPFNFKDYRNTQATHLKFGFIYKLNDRFGISVAPSIYYVNTKFREDKDYYKISPIAPLYEFKTKEYSGDDYHIPEMLHSFGAGISVGLFFN